MPRDDHRPPADTRRQEFGDRFNGLAGMMLRALERRRDRALRRACELQAIALGRPATDDEVSRRANWDELHRLYDQAHDALHKAMVLVHYAAALVRKLSRGGGSRWVRGRCPTR